MCSRIYPAIMMTGIITLICYGIYELSNTVRTVPIALAPFSWWFSSPSVSCPFHHTLLRHDFPWSPLLESNRFHQYVGQVACLAYHIARKYFDLPKLSLLDPITGRFIELWRLGDSRWFDWWVCPRWKPKWKYFWGIFRIATTKWCIARIFWSMNIVQIAWVACPSQFWTNFLQLFMSAQIDQLVAEVITC
jgi:hypothetical protein